MIKTLAEIRQPWKALKSADATIVVAAKEDKYLQQNCAVATENILVEAGPKKELEAAGWGCIPIWMRFLWSARYSSCLKGSAGQHCCLRISEGGTSEKKYRYIQNTL